MRYVTGWKRVREVWKADGEVCKGMGVGEVWKGGRNMEGMAEVWLGVGEVWKGLEKCGRNGRSMNGGARSMDGCWRDMEVVGEVRKEMVGGVWKAVG